MGDVSEMSASIRKPAAFALSVLVAVGLAGGVAALLTWHAQSGSDHNALTAPGLVCEASTHDFGRITRTQAASQTHDFVLRNTGDQPIRVVKQTSTCGCTVVELPKAPIPPGESITAPVTAAWTVGGGRQSAIVSLTTDSPDTPVVRLTVSGFVMVPAVLSPEVVNLGLLKPGQEAVRVVELASGSDPQPFSLVAIENPSDTISIARLPEDPDQEAPPLLEGGPGKFALRIVAPRIADSEEARIVFRTDLADHPELVLRVVAKFEGALAAMPASLLFTDDGAEGVISREVTVRSTGSREDGNFRARLLWKDPGDCPFTIRETKNSDPAGGQPATRVTLGFDRTKAKGSFSRGELRISLGEDSLDVPVIAVGFGTDSS